MGPNVGTVSLFAGGDHASSVAGPGGILWAEDNVHDQMLIRAALEDLDAKADITFVNDGVHLLERLANAKPSLVVLDLKMPRLGGLETLRRIRSDGAWKELPVAIFSAGNQPHEIEACKALGAIDVVHKPVDFREFTRAVGHLVNTG